MEDRDMTDIQFSIWYREHLMFFFQMSGIRQKSLSGTSLIENIFKKT